MQGPRERLLLRGSSSIEDDELLAILLSTGPRAQGLGALALARELLERFGSLAGVLAASAAELLSIRGIGPGKAASLLAVREVSVRLSKNAVALPVVAGSVSAYRLFADLAWESQEVVAAAFLDVRNRVLAQREIFRGTLAGAQARPREILREALRVNAAKILVAHNHPSGSSEPSEEDGRFTAQLEWAACNVGLELIDHLVIGAGDSYFSFAAAGLIGRRE